jgi:hypothetical protein
MSTRFKFFLINSLSRYRFSRDSGFALPMAIMVGASIIIVGLAVVIQAQGNQSKVVSQQAKAVANAAAEAGMTQLQAFLLKNPVLADKPLSAWGTVDGSGNFVPNSTLVIEAASNLKSTSCSYAGMTTAQVQTALSTEMSTMYQQAMANPDDLPNASGNSAMAPKFQVMDYRFNGTNATVHVKGMAGDQAKTNLVASFPVSGGNVTLPTTVFPGLWVKEYLQPGQNDNNPGTLDAEIAYDCSINPGSFTKTNITVNPGGHSYVKYVSSNSVGGGAAVRVALPVGTAEPEVTKIPMPDPPLSSNAPVTPTSITSISSDLVLPRTSGNTLGGTISDTANGVDTDGDNVKDTYYYSVGSISGNGTDLRFIPGKKVVVYLAGNISIGGNSQITHNCSGVSGCDATDVQILGSTANTSGTFSTAGTSAVCSIFFWAPTYTVDMSGGGNAGDCPSGANQNGIYWVKAWEGGGQGSHEALTQSGSNWNKIQSVVTFKVKNKLGANSTWSMMDETGASTMMANITLPGATTAPTTAPTVAPTVAPTASPTLIPTPTPTPVPTPTPTPTPTPVLQCNIPNLVNMNTTSAANVTAVKSAITANGFIAGAGTKTTGTPKKVTSQTPAFTTGAKANCGTTINFNYKQ